MSYAKRYPKPKYIYVIVKRNSDWIKLGMSQNPNKRLSDFKVGTPFKDEFYIAYTRPTEYARDIEKFFKNNYESSGEWYCMTAGEAVAHIDRYILMRTSNKFQIQRNQNEANKAIVQDNIKTRYQLHSFTDRRSGKSLLQKRR